MNETNTDQRDFWTDQAGPTWVAEMAAMDHLLAPVLDQVLALANLHSGARVLDIGCGGGTSTLAAGARVGPAGHVTGLDISATLLDVAAQRAKGSPQVKYLQADAQTYAFDAGQTDCMISRFGVMFFEDPNAAFFNMAQALRPGGQMVFACWGLIPNNPYFTMPAQIAKQMLGPVPKTDPDGPGPFAFREVERVKAILQHAGMEKIFAQSVDLMLLAQGDVATTVDLLCQIGPAQRSIAHHQPDGARLAAFKDALGDGLAQFQTPDGLAIPASINFFTALKPA